MIRLEPGQARCLQHSCFSDNCAGDECSVREVQYLPTSVHHIFVPQRLGFSASEEDKFRNVHDVNVSVFIKFSQKTSVLPKLL